MAATAAVARVGTSIAEAGDRDRELLDVNGDGYADFLVGAPLTQDPWVRKSTYFGGSVAARPLAVPPGSLGRRGRRSMSS